MELTATIVGKQEDFDQLAIRAVILASDKKRYTCRVLDQKDNRDLVMDGQRRLLDAFELVERYDIPNTLRALGEFVDPDLGWRGWVTPLVSGCSLHLIQNLPNSGMILLLYEGCRTLDALDRLQENGKPLNAVLRSLDPRSIVISSSGKVTFTSLDHLRFEADFRRADTEALGIRIQAGHVPDGPPRDMADSLFLLASLVMERRLGRGLWEEALAGGEEAVVRCLQSLVIPSDLRSLLQDMLRWDRGQRPGAAECLSRLDPIYEQNWEMIKEWCDKLVEPPPNDPGDLLFLDIRLREWRGDNPPRQPPAPQLTTAQATRNTREKQAAALKKEEEAHQARAEQQRQEKLAEEEAHKKRAARLEKIRAEIEERRKKAEEALDQQIRVQTEVLRPQEAAAKKLREQRKAELARAAFPKETAPPPRPSPRPVPAQKLAPAPVLESPATPVRQNASTPAVTEFLRDPKTFEERPTEVVRSPVAPLPPAPPPAPTPVQHMSPLQKPSQDTSVLRQKYWSERRAEIAVVVSVVAVLAALISLYATGLWLKWWSLPL